MYLLFDIGGTKMRIAISSDGVTLQEVKSFNTPQDFDEAISIFTALRGDSYKAIVGGIAGVRDKSKATLVYSPNLRGWVGKPIKNRLEEIFGAKVILENDAALAGLGEAAFGAGKERKVVAYLTISTGIGGARIVNGKIDKSVWGFEPGKQVIDIDKNVWPECADFNPDNIPPGSVESYASGAALNFRYGKPPNDIEDVNIWREVEKYIAAAVYNTIAYWSPDVIILGGGMVLEGAVSLENINNNVGSMVRIFPEIPQIVKAQLSDNSGLFGALSLAKTSDLSSD